ncbi:MAG: NADP-dependent oxidoreductase [Deltaproteobacteria bacterium]|nr:NADP-dependent oxidoreductase [Deltaproteobacteria bacterium]
MTQQNRQWRLRARPDAVAKESDFELHSEPMPVPEDGQFLARTRLLSFEPAMRGWMEDRPNYIPPVGLGDVMRGIAVSEVVESRVEGYAPGDLVTGMTGWQEFSVGGAGTRRLDPGTDPKAILSVLGLTGMTAYFGLLEVGAAKEGDTVVVSGAAGATGSVVGQIARVKGCRVVGIAGGPEKCRWLTEEARFDAAIDYKNEDIGERLSALCPEGIDVFFDNVGGAALDAALARIARGARVVICGAVERYSVSELPPGPANYINLMIQRARMEGFVVLDHAARFGEATAALEGWVKSGDLVWQVDIQKGFENVPKTLLRLYTGANQGKQLLEV